ncbi:MAG: ribonucleoside triphosphate reductase, partial [Lachnospiraceae bacterium]|nr:ribonucleoside triphosphate reductase [Lachnospiraceae bacterium]
TVKAEETVKETVPEEKGTVLRLFATTTCPNCKIVAAQMDRMGVPYTKIYANETPAEAIKYSIKQAPTLVVEENGETQKFVGVADIKKFLAALKAEA